MQNNLREISKILYRLKRQYGLRLDYYRTSLLEQDVETGETLREYSKTTILRAIVLPASLDRDFVYDLTYIAANNNFVTGAFFDITKRKILLDGNDIALDPNLNDHVEFDGQRYEIAQIHPTAQRRAFILVVQGLSNSETVG